MRLPAVHRLRGTARTQADGFQYTRYMDIKNGTSSFLQPAAFISANLAVGVGDAARERRVRVVSAAFWDFFAARPSWVASSPPRRTRRREAPTSSCWGTDSGRRNSGARLDVLGQTLQVNNVSATIIGVAPEGFVGIDDNDPPALFMPITTYRGAANAASNDPTRWFTTYTNGWVSIMVRRRPGVSVEQASGNLTRAFRASYRKEMALNPGMAPLERSKPIGIVSAMKIGAGPDPSLEARTALWVTGVAAIVLLIACANVAESLSHARVASPA